MIIYGWNGRTLKEGPLKNYECPSCGEKNSHVVVVAQYIHVFWIPIFVYKKAVHVVCMSCNYSMEGKDFPPEEKAMKENIKLLKSSVKTPFYLYLGLIAIVLAIGYFTFTGVQNSIEESAFLKDPQIGDVYVLEDLSEVSAYKYYLLKVQNIDGDSLHMTFNSFSYNTVVRSLDPSDGFYDVWYAIPKSQLNEFEESGELRKVIRDYTAYSGFDRTIHYPDSSLTQ